MVLHAPGDFESLEDLGDGNGETWSLSGGEPAIVQFLTDTLPENLAAMKHVCATFRLNRSQIAGESYWMNHCGHCGSKQGDHYLTEPHGAFNPNDESDAAKILLHEVAAPFAGAGGYTLGIGLLFEQLGRA